MTDYPELRESLKSLAGSVDHDAAWDQIQQRAKRRRPLGSFWDRTTSRFAGFRRQSPSFAETASAAPGEERIGDKKQLFAPKPFAPRWRSGQRVAVFASIAVVLVAAITVGSLEAVKHLGKDQPVVVINDDTAGMAPGSTGQTTQTATSAEGTWLQLPLLAKGETIRTISISALVMDPSDPAILYATTSEGLFKSSDGAGSWSRLPTIPGDVGVPFIDPTSPSTIYVVCSIAPQADQAVSDHLLRSDDGGVTWTDLTEAGAPRKGGDLWVATAFDTTTTPSTIYMWDDTGYVWRSTDRGTTWTRLSFDEGMQAFEQADSPRETPSIPAAAQKALDDFLAPVDDWVDLTDADTGAVVGANGAPLVDPNNLSTFYVATFEGVYKSIDGGRTWRKASTGLPDVVDPADAAVSAILVDPNAPSTLYVATDYGVFRSTDSGTSWAMILRGSGSVVLAPSNPSRLYGWTDSGLFRSDDGGTNWTRLDGVGLDFTAVHQLVLVVANQPDTVFAIGGFVWGGLLRLYRSTDAGNTWQSVVEGVQAVAADPQHPSTIYVSTYAYPPLTKDAFPHLLKSTDAGATWTELALKEGGDGVVDIAVDPFNSSDVYTIQCSDAGAYSVSRSRDGGATWEKVELDGAEEATTLLVFDLRSANTLYASMGPTPVDGDIHRSTDAGVTWENTGGNIRPESTFGQQMVLVPDTAPGGALYAATPGGLFKWVPSDR